MLKRKNAQVHANNCLTVCKSRCQNHQTGVGPTTPCAARLTRQPRSKRSTVTSRGVLVTDMWRGKKVSMAVLVFSITHTKLLCHTDTSVLQLSNEPELEPGSCFTSIIKFSAGRRVSHLDIKKDSRQTQKVLLCSHAGCVLQDLLHINRQSSSSSYRQDWNRGVSLISVRPQLEKQYRPKM